MPFYFEFDRVRYCWEGLGETRIHYTPEFQYPRAPEGPGENLDNRLESNPLPVQAMICRNLGRWHFESLASTGRVENM